MSRVRVPLPTPDISGESRSSGSGSLLIESGFYDGVSPSGKARDFDSRIRWFESGHPSHLFDPLAQLAEHLPFKQGVRGSNPRRVTKKSLETQRFQGFSFLLIYYLLVTC